MAKWSIDINQFVKKTEFSIKRVFVNYVFALYSSIVKKTPVDTGRARGNWNISVGSVDTTTTNKTMKSGLKYTEDDINVNGDTSVFISNNLPYITTLEYGGYPNPPKKGSYNKKTKTWVTKSVGGFSKQAPEGMVGVTLANNDNILKASVKRAIK